MTDRLVGSEGGSCLTLVANEIVANDDTDDDAGEAPTFNEAALFRDLPESRSGGGILFAGHGLGYNSRRIAVIQYET